MDESETPAGPLTSQESLESIRAENARLANENRELRLRLEEAHGAERPLGAGRADSTGEAGSAVDATEHQRTAEALRESAARHRLLAETMLQGVVHQTAAGTIVSMNAAAERILGKSPTEFLGSDSVEQERQTIREDGSQFPGAEHPSMVALRTGRPVRDVRMGVFNPREQAYRWISVDAVPLFRPGEEQPYEVYTVFADITERKRAEEARREALAKAEAGDRMLATLMANVPEGISVCDASGRVRMVSQHGQDILGRRHVGKDVEEIAREWTIYRPDGQAKMPLSEVPLNRALRGEVVRDVELVQASADGRRVPLLCNASPIRDAEGAIVGGVVVWRDISERKHAEEALRASEQKYRDLFNSMIEGFAVHEIICDAEGKPVDYRFVELNPAFERLTGLGRDVIGKTHKEVLPDDDPKWVQIYGKVALTGEPVRFENYSPALKRHYEVAAFRSAPGHFATLFQDITDRKRVEQALRDSERLYRAIGETIDYGVWVCAPDGRNVYASDSFLKLVGQTQEQCSNFGWGDVLHPDDTERTMHAWRDCIRTEGTWDIEHRFRGVDGQWHPILARGVPVRNDRGEITCWAGINLDISRLKQTEDALREADRRKSEFLAALSHELRNPLAPICNSLHILDRVPPGDPQAQRAKQVIERQVAQLTRLVDDLLDVTRITRGKVQLKPQTLELVDLLHRICEDHRSQLAESEVELDLDLTDGPMWVHADATRVAQAVGNLLHNAGKFTPKGGHVRVSLDRDEQGNQAVIRVRDTGVGLAPEVMRSLFQPFAQAHQTLERSQGGLGLGLSLVRGLVELHGGTVEAHSDGPGKGAEFTVRLPLHAGDGLGQVPAVKPTGVKARRVLIIEDNLDAAESLRDALQLGGHEVQVAHESQTGLALARALGPEVILCDIGLPGMDGYGVAQAVRSDPALRSTFLVALTGYTLPEDLARARQAGFDEHLAKPPNLEKVEQLFAKLDAG